MRDKEALKGVYLETEKAECLTILGQNGAGKTSLINVLTGQLAATEGTAEVFNLDIHEQMDEIRSIMGVCPQVGSKMDKFFKLFILSWVGISLSYKPQRWMILK